jgi:MoaA/NifB/PqqE/SkfB family radical SAM enzyme
MLFRAFTVLPRPVRAAVLRPVLRSAKDRLERQSTPSRLILYVTDRCNANCAHCFYGRHLNPKDRDELSLGELERLAGSLSVPLQSLVLTGGEPFLREDILEICRTFDRANQTRLVTLTTNGIRTGEILSSVEGVLRTCRTRLNTHVSLDGMKDTHDRLRGVSGGFDNAVKTARGLKELKNRYPGLNVVSVLTCVCSQNLNELAELIGFVRDDLRLFHKFQFVRSSQTDVWSIDPAMLSDFSPASPDFCIQDPAQRALAFELIRDSNRLGKDTLLGRRQALLLEYAMKVALKHERTVECLAGKIDGVVYTNGDVAVCEMTKPFTNLRKWDMDFGKAWNSADADSRRSQTRRCACTHPCNLSTSLSYDLAALLALSERTR